MGNTKINISQNIKAFRKKRGLTQEQLAEAFGVTVGAVSKWESGLTVPDISIIVELADFFEISTDVLLGYELHHSSLCETIARLKELKNAKAYDEGSDYAEKALQKYPNNFGVVYNSAELFSVKGIERRDETATRRSIELLERSIGLLDQNEDEEIGISLIQRSISIGYQSLGDVDTAVDILKRYNDCGINNAMIGFIMAAFEKWKADDGLEYLMKAFEYVIVELFRIIIGYANAYARTEKYEEGKEVLQWMKKFTESLKKEGEASFLYKMEVVLLAGMAQFAVKSENEEEAEKHLRQAKQLAEFFDAEPEFGFKGVRFLERCKPITLFDDFAETAMDGLIGSLQHPDDEELENKLKEIWERIEK